MPIDKMFSKDHFLSTHFSHLYAYLLMVLFYCDFECVQGYPYNRPERLSELSKVAQVVTVAEKRRWTYSSISVCGI